MDGWSAAGTESGRLNANPVINQQAVSVKCFMIVLLSVVLAKSTFADDHALTGTVILVLRSP